MVVEIWAAVAGASIGVAASGIKGANRETSMEGIRWCASLQCCRQFSVTNGCAPR
jgi:hypothetical protein